MEKLTEYLSSNFAVVLYVIAVPRRFYKDFRSEETEHFNHWLSVLNQQLEELASMRSIFEFVGIGNFFSGNTNFILGQDGVHPNDKGTRNLVRIIHGRILKAKKKNMTKKQIQKRISFKHCFVINC